MSPIVVVETIIGATRSQKAKPIGRTLRCVQCVCEFVDVNMYTQCVHGHSVQRIKALRLLCVCVQYATSIINHRTAHNDDDNNNNTRTHTDTANARALRSVRPCRYHTSIRACASAEEYGLSKRCCDTHNAVKPSLILRTEVVYARTILFYIILLYYCTII